MWESLAVIVPLVVSINALLFKRLDDLDKKMSNFHDQYVSRAELVTKFEGIDYKLEALAERIELRHEMADLEKQAEEARWRWYNSRAIPRKPRGELMDPDGGEI